MDMKSKTKKDYETPQLTVVSFKMERGYAVSAARLDADLHLFEWSSSDPHVTQYNNDATWAGYSWE